MPSTYPICILYTHCQKWKQSMSYSGIRSWGCVFMQLFCRFPQYQYCKSRQRYSQGWCCITQQLLSRGKSNYLKFLNDCKLNTISFIKVQSDCRETVLCSKTFIKTLHRFLFGLKQNLWGDLNLSWPSTINSFWAHKKSYDTFYLSSESTRFSPQDICFSI